MNKEKIEVLETTCEYIDNLNKGIESIYELIQSGNEIEASKSMIPIFDGIEHITKIILLAKGIVKEEIDIEELNEQLRYIIEAFENEDYILIGDLFKYELLPIIDNIQKVFRDTIN